MNSMSRCYHEPCGKEIRREEKKCPTIVKCGCPSTIQLPVLTTGTTSITIASINLDTSCLCDPVVRLSFSAAFTSTVALTTGGVSLQVFKQCGNQLLPTPIGPSWPVVGALTTTTLTGAIYPSFNICDSDSCNSDCCTYTVVATITGVAAATAGAAFNNASLSAIATCKNSCHKCRRDFDR